MSPAARAKAWEFAAGTPLVVFCLFAASGFSILIFRQMGQPPSLVWISQLASECGSLIFFLMQAVLVCIRRPPRCKAAGPGPRLIGVLGAYFSFTLILLPHSGTSLFLSVASSVLLFAGTLGSIFTLSYLGRCFAILPQARGLVTSGPYAHVRHPLYLFEQISLLGVSLQFQQPWASLIMLISIGLQFPRMRIEEAVVEATFPAYAAYRARTPMLIPR